MNHDFRLRLTDLFLPARRAVSELDRLVAAAGASHVAARRALAFAVAEQARETRQCDELAARSRDLEARAIEALAAGHDELASRAAEAIAIIETEVAALRGASVRFAAKVAASRREVDAQRRRLADLDRGRRLARVGAALHDASPVEHGVPLLARAEAMLEAVEADQAGAEAARLEFTPSAETLADDMAEAGFGRPTRVTASAVMARLRAAMPAPGPAIAGPLS